MTKSIQLKLSKVKYSGDSIGDNVRIEIEIFGKFLRVDKRLKAGKTLEINQEIGGFEADRGTFYSDVSITVIEKDVLFNDVGSVKGSIKVNTGIIKPQQFVFEVQVRETRSIFGKFWGTKTALFEIILQAEVSETIRYIPDLDESQGFLKVKLEDDGSIVQLPAYLKVKIEQTNDRREYFTLLEGPYIDRLASVALKNNDSSWLISGVKHEPIIRAKYSIYQKIFILKGRKYKAIDYPEMPWKKGLYDIEIPDYPHKGGRNYLDQSKRAMTWFRIGHAGERYLHTGTRSLGCITIIETKYWMEIYNALIKARKDDFMSIGVLEVID